MNSARPFVLLAIAVLLAPLAEASRTSTPEPSSPAVVAVMKTDAGGQLASLASAAGIETSLLGHAAIDDASRFDLGDVTLAQPVDGRERAFRLGAVELLADEPPRGPPDSYPETRVRGLELLPPFPVGASPTLSLWSRQACGFPCLGLASDGPQDPWGLAIWTSEQIADRYFDESERYGRTAAIRNEALRRALNAEQDAQSAAGAPWWKRAGAAVGSLFGKAKDTDQRVEDAVGEAARDLTRNVVPPSTAPVDRTHRIPSEYGGGPTQSDRIASAANSLSETAGDVAEGGARGGYQAGRDWFLFGATGKLLDEARAARAAKGPGGTYILRDAETESVMRTGRTRDLVRREAEHGRDPVLSQFRFEVDAVTDTYAEQRGREQIIHDIHKPPLNRIRPISPLNPRKKTYMDAGRALTERMARGE